MHGGVTGAPTHVTVSSVHSLNGQLYDKRFVGIMLIPRRALSLVWHMRRSWEFTKLSWTFVGIYIDSEHSRKRHAFMSCT